MARKPSIEKKLANHIAELEAKLSKLQEELVIARQNHDNYVTHKQVIESILGLQAAPDVSKPRRPYKRRKPKAE